MIPVEQRNLWRPDDHPDGPQRGDCMRACLASVFEVSYEDAPDAPGDHQIINDWLKARIPGVIAQYRYLRRLDQPETRDSWRSWPDRPPYHDGYWIATVYSHRIPDIEEFGCGCASRVPGGDPDCEWCGGKPETRSMGIRWGLHAVVMKGALLAWDPHPERTGEVGPFAGETLFQVVEPAALLRKVA